MSNHLIETVDLTKIYRIRDIEITAVSKVNVRIAQNEFVALMGPSGAGKTTLLNLISGLEKPTKGSVFFEGKDLTKMSEADLTDFRCRKIGFVFQLYNLIPVLTALENVELPTVAAGLPLEEGRHKAMALLERVGLKDRLHNRPAELSGGEQQRVAIARSLVNDPPVLMADEPTGNVDTETGLKIIKLLAELNKERGVTVLVSTHDNVVAEHANRILKVRDGEIVSDFAW